MKNNLVKRVSKKVVDGVEKTYIDYYLVFENGKRCYVMPRYIPTLNIKDEQKKENIIRSNTRNATLFDNYADVEKE